MTRRFLASLAALTTLAAATPAAAEGTCDPQSYSSDPTDFAHLTIEDFESFTVGSWTTVTPEDNFVVQNAKLYGMFWADTGWCIPGMDSAPPCGGDNVYLAGAMDLTIEPLVPTTQIVFDYGTQGPTFNVDVTLSDGSVVPFVLTDLQPAEWGTYGTFGYCTGDPNLTIVSMHLTAYDAGIDNLSIGTAAPACDDADGDGFTTCDDDCDDDNAAVYPGAMEVCDGVDNSCDGHVDTNSAQDDVCAQACDGASLRDQILALNLHAGLENALLAKLDNAQLKIDDGKTNTALNMLSALRNQIDAQAGKKIDTGDAEDLLECLASLVEDLAS